MKKVFCKLGKDEIPNCKPNLVEIFSRRKRFLPKLRGNENEILHFGTFSKLWREIENIFLFQKKISIEIYFEKVSSLTEKVPKCKISFSFPLSFNGVVLGENLSRSFFSPLQRFVGKKSFFKSHLPSKIFPAIYSQTFPNPIPDQSQSHQSLPLKTKIQFYQNFLPAKRSANHSMFFRRL